MKKSYVTNQDNVFEMINYNTNTINEYIKMHSPKHRALWNFRKYSKTKNTSNLTRKSLPVR